MPGCFCFSVFSSEAREPSALSISAAAEEGDKELWRGGLSHFLSWFSPGTLFLGEEGRLVPPSCPRVHRVGASSSIPVWRALP